MALFVLAFPEFRQHDYDQIQAYRMMHDTLFYNVVEPHFTLVFWLDGMTPEGLLAEVRQRVRAIPEFDVCLRSAMLDNDITLNRYHVFLVPDEGNSNLHKLHSALYSGLLANCLSTNIDYVPHVGIANSKDPLECLDMVKEWNSREFCIQGHVRAVDIVDYENDVLRSLHRVPLAVRSPDAAVRPATRGGG